MFVVNSWSGGLRTRQKANISHSGTIHTRTKGVDAAFMQFQLHERGIHIV